MLGLLTFYGISVTPLLAQNIGKVIEINADKDWRSPNVDIPFSELLKVNTALSEYYVVFDKNYKKSGGWFSPGNELGFITKFTTDEIDLYIYYKDGCDAILGCSGNTQARINGNTLDIILGGETYTLYGDKGTFPISSQLRKAFQNIQGNVSMQIVVNRDLNNNIGGGTVRALKRLYSIEDPLSQKTINDKISLIPVVKEEDPPLESLIANIIPSVVEVKTSKGAGTGFVLTKNGFIMTNRHVVSTVNKAEISFYDKRKFEATVIRRDSNADIAILSIDTKLGMKNDFAPLPICHLKYPNLGESVIAIGNPLSYTNTITRGIVSSIRENENETLIQTDTAINAGNSGGPLLNKYGEVIGVVNSKIGGVGIEGLGFAVSILSALTNLGMEIDKSQTFSELSKCGNPIIGTQPDNKIPIPTINYVPSKNNPRDYLSPDLPSLNP